MNGVKDDQVLGWAFDRLDPQRHLAVEILIDGEVRALVTADIYRDDLLENGKGGGDHGFAWPIEERFFDGRPHSIEARLEGDARPLKRRIASRAFPSRKPVRATADGPATPILGRLEGIRASEIYGWVYDRSAPARHLKVEIQLDGEPIATVIASHRRADLSRAGIGEGDHGFNWPIPAALFDKPFEKLTVKAAEHGVYLKGVVNRASIIESARRLRVLDARATARAEAEPIELGRPIGPGPAISRSIGLLALRRPTITIVVPVYGAAEQTKRCLDALIAHTTYPCSLLVIDDCSKEPAIEPMLNAFVGARNLRVHRHLANLGFTRTVAEGLIMAGDDDVVLLNSDTRVTPRWLENLVLAAHENDRIGTATPLSDNAGPFSVLNEAGELPQWLDDEEIARMVSQNSGLEWPRAPTAHGFCTYIRRDYVHDVGTFDVEAFPRGYGEENDFSMRGVRRGWLHKVDDRTLVFHERSASFGATRDHLLAAGRAVVDERFPEYTPLVRAFVGSEDLKRVRERVRDAAALVAVAGSAPRKRILFVINRETGGTPQTNRDLMGALHKTYDCLVLRSDRQTLHVERLVDSVMQPIFRHSLERPIDIKTHRSEEYDRVVSGWLAALAIEMIHVRHIALHGLGLFRAASLLSIPIVVSFHDFYTVCPNTKLLDAEGAHCGGVCTTGVDDCDVDLWPRVGVPPLKHRWVHGWRQMMGEALSVAAAFVTTSERAVDIMTSVYPQLKSADFRLIPHGRDFARLREPATPVIDGKIRILVPGNINGAKGAGIISRLKKLDVEDRLEIHVVGNVSREFDGSKVVLHGPYRREEALDKFARIEPHFGVILSIWPETYCHTLTEMWAAGVAVAGFDIGAVGERLRRHGGGWALDVVDAETLYAKLLSIATVDSIAEKQLAVREWQLGYGSAYGVDQMAAKYAELYKDVAAGRRVFRQAVRPAVSQMTARVDIAL